MAYPQRYVQGYPKSGTQSKYQSSGTGRTQGLEVAELVADVRKLVSAQKKDPARK